jgi:uncharacterized protein YjiS (DUF1127 family)
MPALTSQLDQLASHPLPAFSRVLVAATLTVVTWQLRYRTRSNLRALPDHMLHDIGLTPMDATFEAEKPFWRA